MNYWVFAVTVGDIFHYLSLFYGEEGNPRNDSAILQTYDAEVS